MHITALISAVQKEWWEKGWSFAGPTQAFLTTSTTSPAWALCLYWCISASLSTQACRCSQKQFLSAFRLSKLPDNELWNTHMCREQNLQNSSMPGMVIPSKDVLPYLLDKLGRTQVRAKESLAEFDLVLQLDYLQSLHLDALGLTGMKAIYMHVTHASFEFYGGRYQPAVKFSMEMRQPTDSMAMQAPHDKVLHQISKISEAFFAEHWPCHTKLDTLTFLRRLFRHVQARVLQLGNFCVVCGRRQEHAGLKPVPCDSNSLQLCIWWARHWGRLERHLQ